MPRLTGVWVRAAKYLLRKVPIVTVQVDERPSAQTTSRASFGSEIRFTRGPRSVFQNNIIIVAANVAARSDR
jgi:hypothetical protein